MPLSEMAAVAATRSYQTALARISDALGAMLERSFAEFARAGRTNRVDLLEWYTTVNPGVQAAGRQAAALTEAYAALTTEAAIVGVEGSIFAELAPIDDPFLRMWRDLGEGLGVDMATQSGGTVARHLGTEAVQAVARNTFGRATQTNERWRRVLTGAETCDWCGVVSTQTYRTQASATFGHTKCDCTVLEITESDPGRYINRELYDQLSDDGVIDKVSRGRSARRAEQSIGKNIARRDAVLEELTVEADPERRMRLGERARAWDRRATKAAAKAAEIRAGLTAA